MKKKYFIADEGDDRTIRNYRIENNNENNNSNEY